MANTAQITAKSLAAVCDLPPTTTEAQVANVPRRHAIRHNMSPGATFTLLPGEDAAAFEQLVADYRDEFKPRTTHELFLVNQMIQAQWRISRIERLQAEVLDVILNVPVADGKSDEAAIVASMGFAHGQTFDRLELTAAPPREPISVPTKNGSSIVRKNKTKPNTPLSRPRRRVPVTI